MSVKVYIAAPYPMRSVAVHLMVYLEGNGVTVTSRWLKAPDEMSDAFAREDLADIASSDVLLAMIPCDWRETGTGGRHVESGYALALGKPIVVWGVRSNIFHHMNSIAVHPTLDEILPAIEAAAKSVQTIRPLIFDPEHYPEDRSEASAKNERM